MWRNQSITETADTFWLGSCCQVVQHMYVLCYHLWHLWQAMMGCPHQHALAQIILIWLHRHAYIRRSARYIPVADNVIWTLRSEGRCWNLTLETSWNILVNAEHSAPYSEVMQHLNTKITYCLSGDCPCLNGTYTTTLGYVPPHRRCELNCKLPG